jgi:hypothetical protein
MMASRSCLSLSLLTNRVCAILTTSPNLKTRFVAAALAIEILVALLFVHLAKGYAAGGGGYEYVLLIGAVCFLIAIRGGGPYSVDRFILSNWSEQFCSDSDRSMRV